MSWEESVPIKKYAEGFYDGPHATPKEADEGPIFLGIKNVTPEGRIDLSNIRHVSEAEFPKWTRRVLPQEDDVVFSYEATLHRYACIPAGFRGCLGRRMALVRPDQTKVDPKFLYYFFLSPGWRAKMEKITIVGATVVRIPLTLVPAVEVSFPELNKQKAIADILSAYDDLIENNRRRIALLEQAARELYKEWFVRLKFPSHEQTKITNGLPEGWERKTVADLGDIVTGKTPSKKVTENFGGDIPFIKTPDMHGNQIILTTDETLTELGAKTQPKKFIPENSILVSCIGTVGVVSLNGQVSQTNQQINVVIPHSSAITHFSYFALGDLKPRMEAIGGGVTMANVNKTKFSSMPINIPHKHVLDSFDEFCRPIFEQIKNHAKQNRALAKARDLLLPRLMNGSISV